MANWRRMPRPIRRPRIQGQSRRANTRSSASRSRASTSRQGERHREIRHRYGRSRHALCRHPNFARLRRQLMSVDTAAHREPTRNQKDRQAGRCRWSWSRSFLARARCGEALDPVFDNGGNGRRSSATITESACGGTEWRSQVRLKVGFRRRRRAAAGRGVPYEAVYRVPYLAHAADGAGERDGALSEWNAGSMGGHPGRARRAGIIAQRPRTADGESDVSSLTNGWRFGARFRSNGISRLTQWKRLWPCRACR